MKFQVLLSIMNSKNPKNHLKKMNIKQNYIVINQVTNSDIKLTNKSENFNKIVSLKDSGLSKSRNMAILNSEADIGLLSDDDMYYVDDFEKIIINSYDKHKDADIIAFSIEYEDNSIRKKVFKEGKINFLKSLKLSSVQLSINLNSVKKNNIVFDEKFGSGSKYFMGEENIFLSDCLKKGLKIYYVPIKIGTLKANSDSKWFKGYNKEYFKSKGAVFYRISKRIYILLIVQFALRKVKLYHKNMSVLNAIKFMLEGVKDYEKEIK